MIGQIETALKKLRRFLGRTEWTIKLFGLPSSLANGDSAQPQDSAEWKNGLVLVQIDGLARVELRRALDNGEMPFLSQLIKREHYQVSPFYSGVPSSTPSVQGELFYGVKTAVPAFAFIEKDTGELRKMFEPGSAAALERTLAKAGKPLLAGGSAYSNIYTGGASESHFCSASIGWHNILKDVKPLAWLGVAILYFPMLIRALFLAVIEIGLALYDVVRAWPDKISLKAELKFILARVGISILLRDMITIGATADISRNLPIIHLNYLGFDEQAHRRGPDSAFAHWSLKGIDTCIKRLWVASHRSKHRHYDLWIYSDHGQESTRPYQRVTGYTITDAVRRVLNSESPECARQLASFNERIAERRAALLGGKRFQKLLPATISSNRNDEFLVDQDSSQRPSVVAMGPVGHVYLPGQASDACALARMAKALVDEEDVPGVLYLGEAGEVNGYVSGKAFVLPADQELLFGATHPALQNITEDVIRLAKHADAGQLVMLGWVAGAAAISFPLENGSHAGIGPRETSPFALLPADVMPDTQAENLLRPLDLRNRALALLGNGSETRPMINARKGHRDAGELRIMTYNVHSCIGMDGRVSPERIARVIARYQPDVVALQELDFGKLRTHGIDQAKQIAEMLDMEYHFHPSIISQHEEYGDAILSHLPFSVCRAAILPAPKLNRRGAEPRGVLWVTINVDGAPVQVLNTHLGLYPEERRSQARELASSRWLAHDDCVGPTILCGDFNATIRSRTHELLSGDLRNVQSMTSGKTLNTFAGRMPTLCLDHILVREIPRVTRVVVPNTELTRLASDHLPLLVDLTIN